MSRKKDRNRAKKRALQEAAQAARAASQPKQPSGPVARRVVIPLAEWSRFERFRDRIPHIEALTDLQEELARLSENLQASFGLLPSDFESHNDTLLRLTDLIRGVEGAVRKTKRRVYFEGPAPEAERVERVSNRPPMPSRKQRKKNKGAITPYVAEIIIEDISDGTL